jgi:hypothetical protein
MPFLSSASARLGGVVLANAAKLLAPTFGSSTSAVQGYSFSISNYSSLNNYSFALTAFGNPIAGTATQTGGIVTVAGIGAAVTATCTITVSRNGFLSNSASTSGTSFSKVTTPTLGSATSELGSFTVSITNFEPATYNISTSAGSVSRTSSTITNSGLANSGTATVTVTASRTGWETSSPATRSGSAIPGCTYTGYSYTQIAGGNCGTCGIICCGSGVPAYNFTFYNYTPYPCNLSGTKLVGDPGYPGSWYCLTSGTGSGLSCGPGTICGGSNGC